MSLLDIDAHSGKLVSQFLSRDHHVDTPSAGAKAVTARVAGEVGGKDETGVVNIDFLALGVHKYQSPFTC